MKGRWYLPLLGAAVLTRVGRAQIQQGYVLLRDAGAKQ
jgi:hypothetical protein